MSRLHCEFSGENGHFDIFMLRHFSSHKKAGRAIFILKIYKFVYRQKMTGPRNKWTFKLLYVSSKNGGIQVVVLNSKLVNQIIVFLLKISKSNVLVVLGTDFKKNNIGIS